MYRACISSNSCPCILLITHMRMRRPGSRLTMLRKMGLCGRPVFQIGREPICQQRTRVAVDCSLDHHMTHKRVISQESQNENETSFVPH